MGTLADASVLIEAERAGADPAAFAGEESGIAAVTASELLHGVHRANPANRARRQGWVERLLVAVTIIPFDLRIARVHARLWADLAASGSTIGYHDLQVAATALALGWTVATLNVQEFSRIPGLSIRGPDVS